MTKYIEAEKLIADIKRQIESAAQKADISYSVDDVENEKKYDVERNVLERLLKLVTSLQQEQPEVDLEKEIEEQINIYYNECEKKLNQMSDDDTDIGFLTLNNFARHFYELGLKAQKK